MDLFGTSFKMSLINNETSTPRVFTENSYTDLEAFSLGYAKYHGYIACLVCVWGVVANLANIVVLTRKNMLSTTNTILTWLAVADLLTMSSYLPVSIHFYIMKDPDLYFPATREQGWIYFMLFHINFSVWCHTVAIWLTICLAIFRYLFICYPTKGMELCSMQRAQVAVVAVYLSTATILIPNYLVTTVKTIIGNNTAFNSAPDVMQYAALNNNGSPPSIDIVVDKVYNLMPSSLSEPILQPLNYWIHTVLIKLVPCVLLTVLTILLIRAMHQAAKRRMKLKSQGKKDESDRARETNRTTGMLLAIVALFLITELPQGILSLCNIFVPKFFENVYMKLGDLLDIAALLNNSINFVLYCTMSKQFRDTFTEVFCGCCPKNRLGWLKTSVTHITSTTTNGNAEVAHV